MANQYRITYNVVAEVTVTITSNQGNQILRLPIGNEVIDAHLPNVGLGTITVYPTAFSNKRRLVSHVNGRTSLVVNYPNVG
jgi:hypothetical protein